VQGAFLPEWIGAAIALAVLSAFSYIQFRQTALAAATAFAPLPGFLLGIALHAPLQPLGYLCGFIIADILLSVVQTKICDGASPADAIRQTIDSAGGVVIWPLALVMAATATLSTEFGLANLMLALLVLLGCASALGVAFLAARYFPHDDEFIVRANRLRERCERWLDGLAFVVQPRWGWSVSDVALIFAVLGYFGGRNAGAAWPFSTIVLSAEVALFAIVAFAASRNVRRAIAFLLTVAVLAFVAFWVSGRLTMTPLELVLAIAVSAMPAFTMVIQSAKFARTGDATAVAALRASEQLAIPIAFFCLASPIALLALGAVGDAILIASGGVAALIVFPAITTAIHDLFPPRVSLDAYRIR
jgi:hypothetical protein